MQVNLKVSKFFMIFYGDSISEKEYYGKKCSVTFESKDCVFEFELMKGLDYDNFEANRRVFDTLVFEDVFLKNKLISFLKENQQLQFFKFRVKGKIEFQTRVSKISFKEKSVVFYF